MDALPSERAREQFAEAVAKSEQSEKPVQFHSRTRRIRACLAACDAQIAFDEAALEKYSNEDNGMTRVAVVCRLTFAEDIRRILTSVITPQPRKTAP